MLIKKSVILTPEENNILEIVEYVKYIRVPFPIYKDIKSLIKKRWCNNNPEKWSTAKIGEHLVCGYSRFTKCAFDYIKNKHNG